MSFEDSFCSSPWFHMRITNQGYYNFCRWQTTKNDGNRPNIKNVTPTEYFQKNMIPIREAMKDGITIEECSLCMEMETHGKISGREKQLLKTGIELDNFEKTTIASPFYPEFKKVTSDILPSDWQIDLGNYCNGACIFCDPKHSSTLAGEFLKLNLISEPPLPSWCNDDVQFEEFINTISNSSSLAYLHFIGGETLITPAFKKILIALIENDLTNVTIGFTTNLMVWDDSINALLCKFDNINLGLSVDALSSVNDYARYPSKIESVKMILDKWVKFGKEHEWLMQIRITPTWITVEDIDEVFEYAYNNWIGVESCNYIHEPSYMRMDVLPSEFKNQAIYRLEKWIKSKPSVDSTTVNTRNPEMARSTVINDAMSYLSYLRRTPSNPLLIPSMVEFITTIESNRKNSILDYKPQYEKFLRPAGYRRS